MILNLDRGMQEPLDAELLQEVQIGGKQFVIVDMGSGKYVNGVFSRYFVVSTACILNKQIDDVGVKDDKPV
jgi:hypothetical protein